MKNPVVPRGLNTQSLIDAKLRSLYGGRDQKMFGSFESGFNRIFSIYFLISKLFLHSRLKAMWRE